MPEQDRSALIPSGKHRANDLLSAEVDFGCDISRKFAMFSAVDEVFRREILEELDDVSDSLQLILDHAYDKQGKEPSDALNLAIAKLKLAYAHVGAAVELIDSPDPASE